MSRDYSPRSGEPPIGIERPLVLERRLAGVAVLAGIAAWVVHLQAGLVLSHYDAKAHLVVARRVIDNITPGWQQIGAVWLPLPHLINVLPVQIDLFYRTGAFASLVSIACFGITVWAAARLVMHLTHSRSATVTAAGLLVLNPNLLYIQSTPMTEPLLVALSFLTVLWLAEWVDADADTVPRPLGLALFAAAWTRYEAWLVIAAALAATGYALWRRGLPTRQIVVRLRRLIVWPVTAVLLFLLNSRVTVGSWFVSGGFYERDPTYDGLWLKSIVAVWWGTHRLSGYVVEIVALLAAAGVCVRVLRHRHSATLLLPVALLASAALPFYAFVAGHPFRIRYMIPLAAACAVLGGLAVGLVAGSGPAEAGRHGARQWRAALVAATLIASLLVESPFWSSRRP